MDTPSSTISAWAKINVLLRIAARRADGYHDLETVFLPVRGLADRLAIEPSDGGMALECDHPGVPCDHRNLVWRAAEAFCAAAGIACGFRIRLEKRIPAAAGLGGGSSDAAAVLRWLNAHVPAPLPATDLAAIARRLGADVPFFLQDQPCLATGIGDQLKPLEHSLCLPIILINPGFPLPTPWAYSHVTPAATPSIEPFLAAVAAGDVLRVAAAAGNGFEPVVFHKFPILPLIAEHLIANGCLCAHLCGSGPTLFGIAASASALPVIADSARREFGPSMWLWHGMAGCTAFG